MEEDLNYIKNQIQSRTVTHVVDLEFVDWFRQSFRNSPCYKWEYIDPEDGVSKVEWYFSPQYRVGYVNGNLIERRQYQNKVYEECFSKAVTPYNNSAPLTP